MSRVLRPTANLCVLIGAYTIFSSSFDLYSGFKKYYQNPQKQLKSLYGSGPVLITGGTEGLGYSYAEEFARLGHDLILLARNKEKLKSKKEFLEGKYNVKVETLSFDLTSTEIEKYEELRQELKGKEVAILMNNAALFSNKNLGELSFQEIVDMIACNCLSNMLLSKIVSENARDKPSKSSIVTIGSQYSDRRSAPFANVYFATKAFTNMATRSIKSQFFKPKIDHVTVFPGLMRTEMYKRFAKKEDEGFLEGLLIEEPDYFAQQTVKCFGYRENEVFGSQRQAFMNYVLKYIVGRFYEI